jgi:glycolate oxidase FAD binding subunit
LRREVDGLSVVEWSDHVTPQMGEVCEPAACDIAALCQARPATAADQIEGVLVRCVAKPRDIHEVSALLQAAHRRDLVVLPRGAATKLGWSPLPPVVDVLLDTSGWDACRIEAGGEQITMGAGCTVAMAQDELARLGRRLPMDPPTDRATVGGMLVTGETGPLAHQFGAPGAHLVDATVVLPDGTVSTVDDRARLLGNGLRDLRWLQPGWPHPVSVLFEATLRTQPMPPAHAWVVAPVRQPIDVREMRDEVLGARLAPSAVELDLPGIRRSSEIPAQRNAAGTLAICFEGAEVSLHDRARQLMTRLGPAAALTRQPPTWWGRYPFRPEDIALRLYTPDGELHPVFYALVDLIGLPIPVRGSIGVGQAWAAVPGDLSSAQVLMVLETVREVLLARGGSAVVQSAPARHRDLVIPYRVP